MTAEDDFYLTGSFNDWQSADPCYRFEPVISPYGRDETGTDHTQRLLHLGGYTLHSELPAGPLEFKIVRGGDWEHQWSVARRGEIDKPYRLTEYCFTTRHGMSPCLIAYRGDGLVPHAEYDAPGGSLRWDFHPASGTLTIHQELHRGAGVLVRPWREFPCDAELAYDTWVSLPFGYEPAGEYRHPVCYLFDGRSLLYGENPWRGQFAQPGRQFPRVCDLLARQGTLPPVVIVAIGVPRPPRQRRETYWRHRSRLHRAYVESICTQLMPAVWQDFRTSTSPDDQYLAGLSNGGDLALAVLAAHADRFRAAVALSPEGGAEVAERFRTLSPDQRRRLRVAMTYTQDEPAPCFAVGVARAQVLLQEMGVSTAVQYLPGISHNHEAICQLISGSLSFAFQ